MEITIKIKAEVTGTYSEEELKEFIEFELGGGCIHPRNPFYHADGNSTLGIRNVEIEES